jgi:hypothetical protein
VIGQTSQSIYKSQTWFALRITVHVPIRMAHTVIYLNVRVSLQGKQEQMNLIEEILEGQWRDSGRTFFEVFLSRRIARIVSL